VSLRVSVAALSDVGCVRKNNEDAYGYDPVRNLFIVCDGVGGMNSGEVASDLTDRRALAMEFMDLLEALDATTSLGQRGFTSK